MATEGKSRMASVRLPTGLFERLDFVARNTDDPAVKNRSTAVYEAVVSWLPSQEARLVKLGIITKKAPR